MRQLGDKLRRYEDELDRIKGDLRWEQRRESVLSRMLDMAKDKVRNILKVKDKHRQKVAKLKEAVERLEAKIAIMKTNKANMKSELGDSDMDLGSG
jgi:chromosome segregation ATPase